jgi:hypothetical protein
VRSARRHACSWVSKAKALAQEEINHDRQKRW